MFFNNIVKIDLHIFAFGRQYSQICPSSLKTIQRAHFINFAFKMFPSLETTDVKKIYRKKIKDKFSRDLQNPIAQ